MRPIGWRGESYRHYLAAKGVKTSYFKKTGQRTAGHIRMGAKMPIPYAKGTDGGDSVLSGIRKKKDDERQARMRDLNVVEELEPEELTRDERLEMVKRRRGDFHSLGDPVEWREIKKDSDDFKRRESVEDLKKEFPHKSYDDLERIREGRLRTASESNKFDVDLARRLRAARDAEEYL